MPDINDAVGQSVTWIEYAQELPSLLDNVQIGDSTSICYNEGYLILNKTANKEYTWNGIPDDSYRIKGLRLERETEDSCIVRSVVSKVITDLDIDTLKTEMYDLADIVINDPTEVNGSYIGLPICGLELS